MSTGVNTSEFWLCLVGLIFLGAYGLMKAVEPEWILTAMTTLIGIYTASRTITKGLTVKNGSNGDSTPKA